ncbi:hypothetical protein E2C01_005462 [Portunus trituberculatus]|uniref:Uncharacterized protein n=1 Tax=Portunus trituberculatus TaxID=210409 RepID=A0A5B7CUA1_PORTR|nr:hypothetical protein [Portunus trituberculatus]
MYQECQREFTEGPIYGVVCLAGSRYPIPSISFEDIVSDLATNKNLYHIKMGINICRFYFHSECK